MTQLFLPYASPIVDPKTGYASDAMKAWMRGITPQAASGGGAVMSVSGTAPISSTGGTTPVLSLNDTAVTPGTYGDTTHVGQFTVDQKGRLTFAADVAIAFPAAAADYVVMSNGANPPTPMDDGAGNFLYMGYTP